MATAAYTEPTATVPHRAGPTGRRVAWIDIARGLGIVLVVYGHCLRGLALAHLLTTADPIWASDYTIYTFHMPLFFLLAGLQVDRSMARGTWPFLRSKLLTIAYPYVLWSLFQTGMQLLVPGLVNTPHAAWTMWAILWRPIAQFWFLYMLFLCHLLAFLTRGRRSWLIPLTLLCLVAAVAASHGVPYSLATPAALAHWFLFYAAGIFLSDVLLSWKPEAGVAAWATVISAIALGVFSHFGRAWSGGNADAPASWPAAATGIALLVCGSHLLAQAARRLGDWFEAMGRASLTIYIFHVLAAAGTRVVLRKVNITAWEPQLMLGTIVGVGLPWLIHLALERADLLAPLGLGVRRRRPAVAALRIPGSNDSSSGGALPPLRLAIVANRFQKNDGQGRVNYEVALAALRSGMHLTLLTAYCADEIADHRNATVVRLGRESWPTQLAKNLDFAADSARWLRRHRADFDLVQANGFITWEPCDIVAAHFVHSSWLKSPYYPFKSLGKPYEIYQRTFSKLNSVWEKRTFLSARHIIAVSEVVAADVAALGVPPERIEVIYNGVDTEEFQPGPSERASFNLPEGVPMAVFVGDIRSPRKNLGTLLDAMVQTPGLHLAVAGDLSGSPAPEQARSLGLAGRVHFLGKTSRVAGLMRSVDLFVFPSRYEAHPLVVLEAMASGLPVVISRNVGSVASFGETFAVLDDPDDSAALAGILNRLLASPDRRAEMSRASRERALSVNWSHTVNAYLRAYERLRPRTSLASGSGVKAVKS